MRKLLCALSVAAALCIPVAAFADDICAAHGYVPGTDLYLRCWEFVQRDRLERQEQWNQQWNAEMNRAFGQFQQPTWGWCTSPYGGVTACAR